MTEPDEQVRLSRLRAGRPEACAELVRAHYQAVYRFLVHLTRDVHEAEDLTQETFAAAWEKIATFEGRATLATWLHRIAYTKCIDARRAERRAVGVRERHPSPEVSPTDPFDTAMADDEARRLYRALDWLDTPGRTVLVLHYLRGLSYREMALVLDEPTGTVKWRTAEALKRLRAVLGDGVHDHARRTTAEAGLSEGKNRDPDAKVRAFLEACGGTADGVIRFALEARPSYALVATKLDLPPDQFEKEFQVEMKKHAGNPVFQAYFPAILECRWAQARADVRRSLLAAALAVQLDGRDALKTNPDPVVGGPFEYVAFEGGYELRSKLKQVKDKPVMLTVGQRSNGASMRKMDIVLFALMQEARFEADLDRDCLRCPPLLPILSRMDLAIAQLLGSGVIRCVTDANEGGLAYPWTYLG